MKEPTYCRVTGVTIASSVFCATGGSVFGPSLVTCSGEGMIIGFALVAIGIIIATTYSWMTSE